MKKPFPEKKEYSLSSGLDRELKWQQQDYKTEDFNCQQTKNAY